MDNQNPVTPTTPLPTNGSTQNDLPISEIVSALKNAPAPANISPIQPVMPPVPISSATPAPRSPAVRDEDPSEASAKGGAPLPVSPLYENPDLVKVPGQ